MRLAAVSRLSVAILLTVVGFADGMPPTIRGFSPPYGPLIGRTRVEITISDVPDFDILSIQLANVTAWISGSKQMGDVQVVTCESGESSSLISEIVSVTVRNPDGLEIVLWSTSPFIYKPNPELYRMENNAVIKSGGIRLWVTGMNLLSVMSPVMIIQRVFQREVLRIRVPCIAYNNTKMSCLSPNLKLDETTTLKTTFATMPSNPTTTLLTKGSTNAVQPVTSPAIPSVPEPTVTVTPSPLPPPTRQSIFTSTVVYTVSSQGTTPIQRTVVAGRRRRAADEGTPDYFAGFELDGMVYSNFSRILVYDDPVFYNFEEEDRIKNFFPLQETEIIIKGERLSLALQPNDIEIHIGKGACVVTSLTVNQLTCTPPSDEPGLDSGQDKHQVLVKAGTTLEYFVGYLKYAELQGKIPRLLMLILIGVGVFIFWVFVFCIVCYVTRRKKKKIRSKHSTTGSNISTGQTYLTDPGSDTDSQGMPFMGTLFNTDPLDILPPDLRHKVIQCRLDSNRLHVGQCIGTGSYGRVFRGTLLDVEEDSITVAVKTMKKVSVYYEREMTDFLHEALVMKDLRHPNIIHLYGVVIFNYAPFVVFEYMDKGDLRTYIKAEKNIPLKQLLTFSLQIAHALTYLTSQNFVHMDVAARNCLINSRMRVKLGDFGLSRDLHGMDYYKLADRAKPMPVKWMALESLQWGRFTSHSDVWAFGVLLWELLTRGQRPYEEVDNMDIKIHIASGNRLPQPRMADNNLYNIMTLTWREDPSSRPTFEELAIKIQEAIDKIPS